MANLVFSREDGTIYLLDEDGNVENSWDAGNNVSNPNGNPCEQGSNGPAPNGNWNIDWGVQPRSGDAYGGENEEFIPIGDYGEDGCHPSDAAAEREIGIHGGREDYESPTNGCIRMNDDDIDELEDYFNELESSGDPIDSITIQDEAFDAGDEGPGGGVGDPPLPPDDGGGSVPNPGDGSCEGEGGSVGGSAPNLGGESREVEEETEAPEQRVVRIEIRRGVETDQATTGTMTIGNRTLNFLELPDRNNAATNDYRTAGRISTGTYQAHIRRGGSRGWRLELEGVPGRTEVQIHRGNIPRDTTGCILPGTGRGRNWVNYSREAMNLIREEVENAGEGARIEVIITDPPVEEEEE